MLANSHVREDQTVWVVVIGVCASNLAPVTPHHHHFASWYRRSSWVGRELHGGPQAVHGLPYIDAIRVCAVIVNGVCATYCNARAVAILSKRWPLALGIVVNILQRLPTNAILTLPDLVHE